MQNHAFQTSHAMEAYRVSRDLWDTPVFESRSFVALPTVGALVEGWLLVVPRTPALSYAGITAELFREFEMFLEEVALRVQSVYGPVSIFEHGPSRVASTVGCGVDYAHFHVVPTPCDLLTGAQQIAPNVVWRKVSSVKNIRELKNSPNGYWFLQQMHGSSSSYIGSCTDENAPSQLFRRVIASHLGIPSAYDWKTASGESLIASTVEKLTHTLIPA